MIQKTPQLEILKNLVVRAPSQFLGIVRKSAVLLFGLEISAISLMPLGIPDLISSLVDTYRSLKMKYPALPDRFSIFENFPEDLLNFSMDLKKRKYQPCLWALKPGWRPF